MYEVVPAKVWLGHAGDLRDPAVLERCGIKALIHVALEELLPALGRELLYCHFPLVDGAGSPRHLVAVCLDTTATFVRAGIPTLVCCSAGMSRSPSIVAGALAMVDGGDPNASLKRVISNHPHDVSPAFWDIVVNIVQTRHARSDA